MKTGFAAMALLASFAAACGPSQPAEPTPEEMGQDEAGAPMAPAPDPQARRFDAMSKTAEAFTGAITLSAEPRPGPNAPPAMKLAAANGLTFHTELIPGGAEQASRVDWNALFGAATPSIDVHSVVREDVPEAAVNGGYCGAEPTSFLAMATGLESGGQPFMSIAAFRGDVWPPVKDDVLCGTFNYTPSGAGQ